MLLRMEIDFENIVQRMSKKLSPRPENCPLKYLVWVSYYMSYLTTYLTHNPYVSLISAALWTTEIVDVCSKQTLSLTRLHFFLKNLLLFVMHFYAFRHWLLTIVSQRNFCHYAKQPILWYVLFSTFCPKKSTLC